MTMKLSLLFLSLLLHSAFAETTQTWSGKADITFDGTSTLHDWGGKVSAKPFITQAILDDAGKPTRLSAEVTVEAAKMDTAEAKRDENMRKAMKVTDHPLISAKIDVPADKIAADGKTPTKLPMTLTLLGKPQQITGTISNWKLNGGKATFDLEFPVSMKASGISVPTVLLFIKVGDGIKVRASVTLTKN
jgi:polyisoprenoid-binding protein YceI